MTWTTVTEEQPTVSKILENGLRKNQLSHAYLFDGPRGTGKEQAALMLAKSYFCLNRTDTVEPCGECVNCRRIDSGNHPDCTFISPDGQSIKKHQVQELIKAFNYRGMESAKKFFIVRDAEKMTAQAANSLLKFIEEPQSETIAVLMTTQIHQMLDTIISRCQALTFRELSPEALQSRLEKEGITPAIAKLAAASTQSFAEALEMSRDGWFAEAREIVLKLMEDLDKRPNQAILAIYEKWEKHFDTPDKAVTGLDFIMFWYRDLMHKHLGRNDFVYLDQEEMLDRQTLRVTLGGAASGIETALAAKNKLKANVSRLSVMEQLVLELQGG